ncbi:MAG: CARDB domain-containing protein [Thermoplasmatota archaeon]
MNPFVPTLAALLFVLAFSAPATASGANISIKNFLFSPNPAGLDVGETATWTNDESSTSHTVTSDVAGLFDSGTLVAGATFDVAVSVPGTIAYHCSFHSSMHGKLYVGTGLASSPNLFVSSFRVEGSTFATVPVLDIAVPDPRTSQVEITVSNFGGSSSGATTVNASYVDATGTTQNIGSAEVPALAPGASASVSITWQTLGLIGSFEVTAFADPMNAVVEGHEGDNMMTGHVTFGPPIGPL